MNHKWVGFTAYVTSVDSLIMSRKLRNTFPTAFWDEHELGLPEMYYALQIILAYNLSNILLQRLLSPLVVLISDDKEALMT